MISNKKSSTATLAILEILMFYVYIKNGDSVNKKNIFNNTYRKTNEESP